MGFGTAGLIAAVLALTQPHEPATFSTYYEASSASPFDRAIRIDIGQDGRFTVRCAPGAAADGKGHGDCKALIRSGSISKRDLLDLRRSIRDAGFYRWKAGYTPWYGGGEPAKLCVSEAGKTRCVQVKTSSLSADIGPPRLFALKYDLFELVRETPEGKWN